MVAFMFKLSQSLISNSFAIKNIVENRLVTQRLDSTSHIMSKSRELVLGKKALYSTTPTKFDIITAEGTGNACRIKVVGVGGGGGNAVNRMMESSLGVSGVDFWIVNTDAQALSRSLIPQKLKIGDITSRWDAMLLTIICTEKLRNSCIGVLGLVGIQKLGTWPQKRVGVR